MTQTDGRSREGAWIEMIKVITFSAFALVAPVRERGLKCALLPSRRESQRSRSREGAWIEIHVSNDFVSAGHVAPVRERGLKLPPEPARDTLHKSLP